LLRKAEPVKAAGLLVGQAAAGRVLRHTVRQAYVKSRIACTSRNPGGGYKQEQ
jgi:hypothetical protein